MLSLQLLFNAIALGAAYALVALGFVLILNATGAVNFAQGDLVMVGGFGALALGNLLGLPGIVLMVPLLVVMIGIGFLLGEPLISPFASARPIRCSSPPSPPASS